MTLQYNKSLHNFRAGWVTGNTPLKAKIIQHLTKVRKEVLYEIFLDIKNAYDTLDQERCLEILVTYGVGPRTEWHLQQYWKD